MIAVSLEHSERSEYFSRCIFIWIQLKLIFTIKKCIAMLNVM